MKNRTQKAVRAEVNERLSGFEQRQAARDYQRLIANIKAWVWKARREGRLDTLQGAMEFLDEFNIEHSVSTTWGVSTIAMPQIMNLHYRPDGHIDWAERRRHSAAIEQISMPGMTSGTSSDRP